MSDQVRNPEDRFSHDEARIIQAYDNQISQLKGELQKEMEHEPIKGTVKPQIKQPKVSPPKVPQKKTEVTPPKQKSETDSSGADSTQVSPSVQEDKGKNIYMSHWHDTKYNKKEKVC